MIRTQLLIGAALIAGAAIGYLAKPERVVERDDEVEESLVALFSDRGEEASISALRARVADLERQLLEKGGEGVAQGERTGESGRGGSRRREWRNGPPTAQEMREHFARMQKEDPVRYAQMTNRFAQMRQHRLDRALAKVDFLSSVDTSSMSETARKNHESLQKLIARREEIEDKMFSLDTGDDERRQIFQEMREIDMAMRELNMNERENLLQQVAQNIGLEGDEAAEMQAAIMDIIDATDSPHRH